MTTGLCDKLISWMLAVPCSKQQESTLKNTSGQDSPVDRGTLEECVYPAVQHVSQWLLNSAQYNVDPPFSVICASVAGEWWIVATVSVSFFS